nr:hypothetical protein [Morchella crassipes]
MRKKGSRQPPPPQTLFSLNSGKIWAVVRGWLARERGAENTKAAPLPPLGHPSWTPPPSFYSSPPSHHRPSLSLNIFFAYFYLCYYYYKKYEREGGGTWGGGGIFGGGFKRSSKFSPPTTIIQHPFVRRSLTKGVDLRFYLNFASFKAKQVFVRSENLLSLYNEII